MSSPAPSPAPAPAATTADQCPAKPKPCCVCKDEKAARDDCMLFSRSDDPAKEECKGLVDKYKACMAGFGFAV
ncbi:Cytochrome c oxidase copper chaperone [Ascosphaera acerosa]|nr:Cytochrome c oxidase copper chaperone [Ascosphaera acerosa]